MIQYFRRDELWSNTRWVLAVMDKTWSIASASHGISVTAALAVANIVKTSLGPEGLDKMLVDQIGEVTISNDGATILKLLEVEHPAAKVRVTICRLRIAHCAGAG